MSTGNEYSVSDIEKAILADMGVSVTVPDAPGKFIRFDVRKRGDKAGWCIWYENRHCTVALYGDWISAKRYEWINKDKKEITPEIKRELEDSRKRRDEELKRERDRVAADAAALYESLPEASDEFPYLVKKGVKNHDGLLRYWEEDGSIVFPARNGKGEIRSLERIFPDGRKRFYPGGEKKGNYAVLGSLEDRAFLCEGYATGASIFEATGIPVVIAFDCHNLKPVADAIGNKVKLIVVADNDEKENGANPGLECAKESGLYYVLIPDAGMDANDYASRYGLDALRNLLCPSRSEWIEDGNSYLEKPAPTEWLVKNWFPRRGIGMIFGASNAGKSFVALDLMLTLTTDLGSWHGFKARRASGLYLCGEGNYGMRKRVALWAQEHQVSDLGAFKVTKGPKRINEGSELAYIEEQIEISGFRPDLIVVDTLNMHYSGDENDAQDMGTFIAAIKELSDRYSAFVLIIHHTGVSREAADRARGSSALNGALDVSVCVSNEDGYLTLNQVKQKDAERLAPFELHLRGAAIEGWYDEDGEEITSAVVEDRDQESEGSRELKGGEEMQILTEAWLWSGCGVKCGYPVITRREIKKYLKENTDLTESQIRSYFYSDNPTRFLRKLRESGRISEEGDEIRVINNADISVCFLLEKQNATSATRLQHE